MYPYSCPTTPAFEWLWSRRSSQTEMSTGTEKINSKHSSGPGRGPPGRGALNWRAHAFCHRGPAFQPAPSNWCHVGMWVHCCLIFLFQRNKKEPEIQTFIWTLLIWKFGLLFSCQVMSDSSRPHGVQHIRLPCPSPSLSKFMSTESVMPSNHLILCCPLLLLPSVFPSIRVFSS